MNAIKNKYEIVFGVATVAISLNIFKELLSNMRLGFTNLSLFTCGLWMLGGLLLSLYLFVLVIVAEESDWINWKIFNVINKAAWVIFILTLSIPIIIFLDWVVYSSYSYFNFLQNHKVIAKTILTVISACLNLMAILLFCILAIKIIKSKNEMLQQKIQREEILESEKASRLYEKGYYSHSILECFKVIESHFYRRLMQKNVLLSRQNFQKIINVAFKEKIIDDSDLETLKKLYIMRNIAAHSNIEHTKAEAKLALEFIEKLIKKDDVSPRNNL